MSDSLTTRPKRRAKRTVENAAAAEIRNKRGFPHAAWKSVAQNSDPFPHFPQSRRRFILAIGYAQQLLPIPGKISPADGAHPKFAFAIVKRTTTVLESGGRRT